MREPWFRVKRVYHPADVSDGSRVLVDRLWPRGLTKVAAALDLWLKDIAPSDELRRWSGHRPEHWDEFRRRYAEELDGHPAEVARVIELRAAGSVTLLYAARDIQRNNAVALAAYLDLRLG